MDRVWGSCRKSATTASPAEVVVLGIPAFPESPHFSCHAQEQSLRAFDADQTKHQQQKAKHQQIECGQEAKECKSQEGNRSPRRGVAVQKSKQPRWYGKTAWMQSSHSRVLVLHLCQISSCPFCFVNIAS